MTFKAPLLEEQNGKVTQTFPELEDGDLPERGSRILKGQVQGRTVIDFNR